MSTSVGIFGDGYLPPIVAQDLPKRYSILKSQPQYLAALQTYSSSFSSRNHFPFLTILASPGIKSTPDAQLDNSLRPTHIRAAATFRSSEQSLALLLGSTPPLPKDFSSFEPSDSNQFAVCDTHELRKEPGRDYDPEPQAAVPHVRKVVATTPHPIVVVLPNSDCFIDLLLYLNQSNDLPFKPHQHDALSKTLRSRRHPTIIEISEEQVFVAATFPFIGASLSFAVADPSSLQLLSLNSNYLSLSLRDFIFQAGPKDMDELRGVCEQWSKLPLIVVGYQFQNLLLGEFHGHNKRIVGTEVTLKRLTDLGFLNPSPSVLGLVNRVDGWKGEHSLVSFAFLTL